MSKKKSTQKVLYVDVPGYKALPHSSILHIAAFQCECLNVSDVGAAISAVESTEGILALVSNYPDLMLFQAFRKRFPKGEVILVTNQAMAQYAATLGFEEHVLLDHIIAQMDDSEWTINELRVTMQKIIRKEIFGIDKYLLSQTPIYRDIVTDSGVREKLNKKVRELAESHRLGTNLAKLCSGISEELLMNAIYDAPRSRNKEQARAGKVVLSPDQYSALEYGCDGSLLAISVRDPFGTLTKDKFFEYLKKVIRRDEGSDILDKKEGGAGLGLFKILFSCHSLICNSQPGAATEVIALVAADIPLRDFSKVARSIHFFRTA